MTVKTNGCEFKKYYSDPVSWPEGAWHDDILIMVDGVEVGDGDDFPIIQDSSKVEIHAGVVYSHDTDQEPIDMETHFKRWRKAQRVRQVLVEIDATSLEELKSLIKGIGGKVL